MASSRAGRHRLFCVEQMLEGKTTLKTQKVTHRNIICIGTDILKDIETFMNSDKDAAVRTAIEETERKLLDERQKVIDEIVEKLTLENNETLEEARKDAVVEVDVVDLKVPIASNVREKRRQTLSNSDLANERYESDIAAVKYRCEVAERKRSRTAEQKFEKEKQEALQKAAKEATRMKEEAVALAEKQLREKLLVESEQKRREAVDQTRHKMKKEADVRVKEAVKNTKEFCEKTAAAHLADVQNRHEMELAALKAKLRDFTSAFEKKKNEKEEFEKLFMDLKEDYKRFQNYTQGFCSDYLMK